MNNQGAGWRLAPPVGWSWWKRRLRPSGAPRDVAPVTVEDFYAKYPDHRPSHPTPPGVRVTDDGVHVYWPSWAAWRYARRFPDEVRVHLRDVGHNTHRAVNENGELRCIGGGV